MADLMVELILASARMFPDALAHHVRDVAQRAGGRDVELLVADLAQQTLISLQRSEHAPSYPVDGSDAGEAYRRTNVVRTALATGTRMWVPVVDSAERLGVLGVTVDDDTDDRPWRALGSLTGELIMAKSSYGDGLALARRTRPITLAAEMRWELLPPLTFASDRLTVTGILEPAYEIAGDTFDYAINGNLVHLAILDAMGHGLEASRMANVAVTSYRHSRRTTASLQDMALTMDEVVQQCFERSRYVTGQLATLHLDTGVFRLLNMGHPVPLLLRDGRVVGEMPSKPVLPAGMGSKPGVILETRLEPGDMVLMYTDGVTEAGHPPDVFGDRRFRQLLDDLLTQDLPPEELLRDVINEILSFQDFNPRDDATLLLAGLPAG